MEKGYKGGLKGNSKGSRGISKGSKGENAPCIYVSVLYVQRNEWKLNDASYRVYNNNKRNECC